MIQVVTRAFYDIAFEKPYYVLYKCSLEQLSTISYLKRSRIEHFHTYDDAMLYLKSIDDELAYK